MNRKKTNKGKKGQKKGFYGACWTSLASKVKKGSHSVA